MDNIEQVSSLTSEGIYYQMRTIFAKPVNVSLTMAHDSLLIEHLSDRASREDSGGKVIGVVGVGMRVDSLKKRFFRNMRRSQKSGHTFLMMRGSSKSLPHIQDMKKQTGLRSVGMNTSGIKYWGGRKKHPIWISGPNRPKTASEKVLYPPVIYRNCHGIW